MKKAIAATAPVSYALRHKLYSMGTAAAFNDFKFRNAVLAGYLRGLSHQLRGRVEYQSGYHPLVVGANTSISMEARSSIVLVGEHASNKAPEELKIR